VLGIYISEERNMFVAEKFIRSLVDKYGKHTVYTDGGTSYPDRSMQCPRIKTPFDVYYPCIRNECNLIHVYNWIQFFVSMSNYSTTTRNNEFEIN
jgi:putative transposase